MATTVALINGGVISCVDEVAGLLERVGESLEGTAPWYVTLEQVSSRRDIHVAATAIVSVRAAV